MLKRLIALFSKKPAPELPLGTAEFDVDGVRLVGIERYDGDTHFRYLVADGAGVKREMTTAISCTLEDHAKFLRRFQEKMARAERRFQEGGFGK